MSSRTLTAAQTKKGHLLDGIPPGFIAKRPRPRTSTEIRSMTAKQLKDRHASNARLLLEPSSTAQVASIQAEQTVIETRLNEIEGINSIQRQLTDTHISLPEDSPMDMDVDSDIPVPPHLRNIPISNEPLEDVSFSRAIPAKRRALEKFNAQSSSGRNKIAMLSFQEALDIEQKAHVQDLERRKKAEEKRLRTGMPKRGEMQMMTKEEREQRIWAFMTAQPTDSDLEDDDDEYEEDDPSSWFIDDQDDGIKGQDIIHPDDNLESIIRVDASKYHYGAFYQPRDNSD